jgi:uncharacterized membrane protein YedE/YeeE
MSNIVEKPESEVEFDVRHQNTMCTNESAFQPKGWGNMKYLLVGIYFGIVLTKSEVVSWFRIQEMFRFQSFHMFGTIFTAIAVGATSIFLLKKFHLKTLEGETVNIPNKSFNKGHIYGGLLFGLGWAITGACPGPIYALVAPTAGSILLILVSALAGTWVYGRLRNKLPH